MRSREREEEEAAAAGIRAHTNASPRSSLFFSLRENTYHHTLSTRRRRRDAAHAHICGAARERERAHTQYKRTNTRQESPHQQSAKLDTASSPQQQHLFIQVKLCKKRKEKKRDLDKCSHIQIRHVYVKLSRGIHHARIYIIYIVLEGAGVKIATNVHNNSKVDTQLPLTPTARSVIV